MQASARGGPFNPLEGAHGIHLSKIPKFHLSQTTVKSAYVAAATGADVSGSLFQHRDCRAIGKDCVVRRLAIDYAASRKINSFDFADYSAI
ncbi:hypothetical protein [Mesorhizobium caraganae]|uniref:hypothetical protein n=1 Tax=Mesorhizobium caraganae TaxID=483206 RepID=UPI003ECCF589